MWTEKCRQKERIHNFDIFKVFVNRYVYVLKKNPIYTSKDIHNEPKKNRVEFEIKWCSEDDASINLFLVLSFARDVFSFLRSFLYLQYTRTHTFSLGCANVRAAPF